MLRGQALFVDAVARFVQDAEEAFGEMPRVVARGQAYVAGAGGAAKGVRGDVEPAGGEIEADGRRGRLAEDHLAVYRILPLQNLRFRLLARALDRRHKQHEFFPQVREDARDLGGRSAGLELV